MNAQKLLKTGSCAEEIHKRLAQEVEEWLRLLPKTEGVALPRVQVCYPAGGGGKEAEAYLFARELCRRINVGSPLGVQREPVAGKWVFPASLPTSDYVVIVDWGAMTGTTVTQLMRLAAEAGAKNILAAICLSQMLHEEEKTLRLLSGLTVYDRGIADLFTPPTPEKRRVDVSIRFISSVKIRAYDEFDCPHCQQLRRIRAEAWRYPSTYLGEFAMEMAKSIRPRGRDEGLKALEDVFGASLTGTDTAKMAMTRECLERAVSSTADRAEVQHQLETILDGLKAKDERAVENARILLCLLASELQWLKRPPLRFRALRDTVANISLQILSTDMSQQSLRHAIIVLRSASKPKFADSLGELAARFRNQPLLLNQLLYDVFTFLNSDYHHEVPIMKALVENLRKCQDALEDGNEPAHEGLESVRTCVHELYTMSSKYVKYADAKRMNVFEAWNTVKEAYYTDCRGHALLCDIADVLFAKGLEDLAEANKQPILSNGLWSLRRRAWRTCRFFLETKVLPYTQIRRENSW